MPLDGVKTALADWYKAYLELCHAMAQMRDSEVRLKDDDNLQRRLNEFRKYHAFLSSEMLKLANGMPEYGDLGMFTDTRLEWRITYPVTAEFLLGVKR